MTKVSVLTPAWNRGSLLPRVAESLCHQGQVELEWIVVDDGSTDNTEKVMEALMSRYSFCITYVKFSRRVGKCRADNLLLDLSSYDLVCWCDSDDQLIANALPAMVNEFNALPTSERENCIWIASRCIDENMKLQDTGKSLLIPITCRLNELGIKHDLRGDMCILVQKRCIGGERFPEKDLVMSESGFWSRFSDYIVRVIPIYGKKVCRTTPNRISGSPKMEYCRGKAYSIVYADSSSFPQMRTIDQLRIASNYHRYCIHGDIGFKKRGALFKSQKKHNYYFGAIIGYIQALKDVIQGRVVKTHAIFEEGKKATYVVRRNFA